MRIAFIITRSDDLGGAQSHVRDLTAALEEKEEVIVLGGGEGALAESLAALGVPFRPLKRLVHPIRPYADLRAFLEIRAALSEFKPALVSTHSNKAGMLGRLAAWSLGIAVVHTSHGLLFTGKQNSFSDLFYRLAEKFAAAFSGRVITVSQSEYNLACRLNVVPEKKLAVVHNGLAELSPPLIADAGAEPAQIVTVARFAPPKDYPTLFSALAGLKAQNWSLSIVGDGNDRAGAERLAEKLNIAAKVSFLGQRDDVPEILAGGQIFVLSSRREGFPISILEAMRAGLPVVASAVGGVAEAVKEGESGLLFRAGDAAMLGEKLEQLIADPGLRRQMGAAGRRRFKAEFSLEQMTEKTRAVYKKLLAEGNQQAGGK